MTCRKEDDHFFNPNIMNYTIKIKDEIHSIFLR